MELQDQIYILTGVCAGLILLLFVLIGYLMYRVAKISELLMGKPTEKRDTYAYNNRGIVHGEELNRRGFMIHETRPSSLNREPTTGLPRIDPSHSVQQQQPQNDFSSILSNQELVFGGDRPSNLNQRNRGLPMPQRVLPPSLDYNDNVTYQQRMEVGHHVQ